MNPAFVSVILPVTNPKRAGLAKKAIRSFLSQYYTHYELIVVNATGVPLLQDISVPAGLELAGAEFREIVVAEPKNAATMRNIGIQEARGMWVFPIDDDDWVHPLRLMYQLAYAREDRPCLLKFQLLVDLSEVLLAQTEDGKPQSVTPKLKLKRNNDGIASTVLFPRVSSTGRLWLYDESINVGEHDELLARMNAVQCKGVVCLNRHNDSSNSINLPLLSVAMYHTDNELNRSRFFGDDGEPRVSVPDGLNVDDISLLHRILRYYNFAVS